MANNSECHCSSKRQSWHVSKFLFKSLPSPVREVWDSSCRSSKTQIQKVTESLKDPMLGAFFFVWAHVTDHTVELYCV